MLMLYGYDFYGYDAFIANDDLFLSMFHRQILIKLKETLLRT